MSRWITGRQVLQVVLLVFAVLGLIARFRHGAARTAIQNAHDLVENAPHSEERVAVGDLSFVVPDDFARVDPELAGRIDAEVPQPGLVRLAGRYPLLALARHETSRDVFLDEMLSAGVMNVDNDSGSVDAAWCAHEAAGLATHGTLAGAELLTIPLGVACRIRLTSAEAPNELMITSLLIHDGADVQVVCRLDSRNPRELAACDALLASAAVGL